MAFGESWLISVMMRFTSNGSAVMREMGAATRAANAAVDAQTAKVNRATLAMQRFRESTIGIGTRVAGAFALAGAAIDTYSIVQAASLQRTLTAIQNETGAGSGKIAQFRSSAFDIGNQIGVAPTQAARVLLDVSRLTAGQLQVAQMLKIAPSVAAFASMIHYNRPNVSVEAATQAGLQLVHLFRAYQPAQLMPLLDKAYRLSGLMSETPTQAVRQMSYFEPLFKGLGIDENTSIGMMAMLDRAGFRNKAGTHVRNLMLAMLQPLQMTSSTQAAKSALLGSGMVKIGGHTLPGLGLYDKQGHFRYQNAQGGADPLAALAHMASWVELAKKSGVNLLREQSTLYSIFGRYGGDVASLFSNPSVVAYLGDIRGYLKNPNVGLAAGQHNRQNTLSFQFGRAWANLQAILTELADQYLPTLTNAFRNLANTLHDAQQWLHGHRKAEHLIGGGLLALTGLSAARFVGGGALKALDFVGAFAGLKGAAGESMGLGEKVFRLFDNIFTLGFAQRLAPVFGNLFKWVFRLLPGVADLIPGVGWLAAIMTAVTMLPKLITHLPEIAVTIANWWHRNEGAIGATIGYAFGTIGRWLLIAIEKIGAMVGAAAASFAHNLWLLATPGGQVSLAIQLAADQLKAAQAFDRTHHIGFGSAFGQGLGAGASGGNLTDVIKHLGDKPSTINQTFNVRLAPGTTSQQAQQIIKAGMAGMRSTVKSHGNTFTTPYTPKVFGLDLSPLPSY